MTPIQQELTDLISRLIRDKQAELGIEPESITGEEHKFLISAIEEFVLTDIDKYLKGVQQHGPGFLESVDHLGELENEIRDLWNYARALKHKQFLHDKRYEQSS